MLCALPDEILIFFCKKGVFANYLSIKKPQFSYTHITPESLANKRHASNETIPLKQCMKQHVIVFVSHGDITMQEYLCDCTSCLQFKFSECYYHSSTNDAMISATMNEYESDEEEQDDDNYIDRSQQMFDFVEVPSYISLITGNTIKPLYFVKVTEKGIAEENLTDPYDHFLCEGECYFKGQYLKLTRSRNLNNKQFQTLPTNVIISTDEIYDTYVDIDDNMQLFLCYTLIFCDKKYNYIFK